jgi:hypothetical protein
VPDLDWQLEGKLVVCRFDMWFVLIVSKSFIYPLFGPSSRRDGIARAEVEFDLTHASLDHQPFGQPASPQLEHYNPSPRYVDTLPIAIPADSRLVEL